MAADRVLIGYGSMTPDTNCNRYNPVGVLGWIREKKWVQHVSNGIGKR